MRPTTGQYSWSAKHSRLPNRHECLGIAKVGLQVRMSRIAYLSTVLVRLKANDYAGMRHMRVRLPQVRGTWAVHLL